MTKTYALKRLLEHGPMLVTDIVDCTKWKRSQVHRTAQSLMDQGLIWRKTVRKCDGCRIAYEAVKNPFESRV